MAAGRYNTLVAVGGANRRFRASKPFAAAARGAETASIATAGELNAQKTPTHLAAGGGGPRFIFPFDTLMSGQRRQSRRSWVGKRRRAALLQATAARFNGKEEEPGDGVLRLADYSGIDAAASAAANEAMAALEAAANADSPPSCPASSASSPPTR